MNWASEHNLARLPWRTVCILFESPVSPYGDHFDKGNEALRPNNTDPCETNLKPTEA